MRFQPEEKLEIIGLARYSGSCPDWYRRACPTTFRRVGYRRVSVFAYFLAILTCSKTVVYPLFTEGYDLFQGQLNTFYPDNPCFRQLCTKSLIGSP